MPCLVYFNFAVMDVLNKLVFTVSLCTLVLFLVVVSKPKYDRALALDGSPFMRWDWLGMTLSRVHALLHSVTDGFPPAVYYAGYSTICLLMQLYYPPLSCYLLLDIVVKSKTTVSVLMAVYKPRKQIFVTLILLIMVAYIFTVNYFFSFRLRNYVSPSDSADCFTLLSCFLSGYAAQTEHRIFSGRVGLDILFYFVVLVILINVVFGIVIDTFANLREEIELRETQTDNFCFACGIPSETFDRAWQHETGLTESKTSQAASTAELTGWRRHLTLVRNTHGSIK
jgi:hypothetical protein